MHFSASTLANPLLEMLKGWFTLATESEAESELEAQGSSANQKGES